MYDLNNKFVSSFLCLEAEVALQQETQVPTLTETEKEKAPWNPCRQRLRPFSAGSRYGRRDLPSLLITGFMALRKEVGRKVRGFRVCLRRHWGHHPILEGVCPNLPIIKQDRRHFFYSHKETGGQRCRYQCKPVTRTCAMKSLTIFNSPEPHYTIIIIWCMCPEGH